MMYIAYNSFTETSRYALSLLSEFVLKGIRNELLSTPNAGWVISRYYTQKHLISKYTNLYFISDIYYKNVNHIFKLNFAKYNEYIIKPDIYNEL